MLTYFNITYVTEVTLLIDYRSLNEILEGDSYPLPNIDSLLALILHKPSYQLNFLKLSTIASEKKSGIIYTGNHINILFRVAKTFKVVKSAAQTRIYMLST